MSARVLIAGAGSALLHAAALAAVLTVGLPAKDAVETTIPVALITVPEPVAAAPAPDAPAATPDAASALPVPAAAELAPAPPPKPEARRPDPPKTQARRPVPAAKPFEPRQAAMPAETAPPAPAGKAAIDTGDALEEESGVPATTLAALPGGSASALTAVTALAVSLPVRQGDNPKPDYPRMARDRGLEGQVLVRVEVWADGSVSDVTVLKSSGYDVLDRAAQNSVRRWRFIPAMANGETRAGAIEFPVSFRLTD
jgi:protein TonB